MSASARRWPQWLARLPPAARRLIACRAVRSVGQGALVVDFSLYVHALGWSAGAIGGLYMLALLVNSAFTLACGPYSDSIGRKPFLVGYSAAQMAAALVALASAQPIVLGLAAVIGAFGRGSNGAAGPFGPVEQAWLAEMIDPEDFGAVYSFNAAVGFAGMGVGAALAAAPAFWAPLLPGALAYRPVFALTLLGALVALAVVPGIPERPKAAASPESEDAPDFKRALLRLISVNALNGVSTGMIGPLIALWFNLRYGERASSIGSVIALGFLLSSLASLTTGALAKRLGSAGAVVWTRVVAVVLLAIMPFMPNFWLASACFVIRAAFNRGSSGARQAIGLKLAGSRRRGLGASLNAASSQIPRAIGPLFGGLLMESDSLALPLLISAALQGAYLVLYGALFRRID